MPKPDRSSPEAPSSLDARLNALEAERERKVSPAAQLAMGQGYRFLGEVVGGVLGGTGLGWLVDRFANTAPLGLICGLMIGTGVSVFYAVTSALKASKAALEKAGPLPSVSDDDDDDND
jgi:ATP synthase protein I